LKLKYEYTTDRVNIQREGR